MITHSVAQGNKDLARLFAQSRTQFNHRAVLGAQYALAGRPVRYAARVFAVSPRSISRAQLVLQDGNRALVAEMLEGRWSLTVAASLVTSTQTLLQTLNQRAGQAAEPVSEVA